MTKDQARDARRAKGRLGAADTVATGGFAETEDDESDVEQRAVPRER